MPRGESTIFGWRKGTERARPIQNGYADFDGFVVLHGTDTLAYTASALSFLLGDLDKPVVVTGAQKPIFEPASDGAKNLRNALAIAGYQASNLPLVPEVSVCFGSVLLRGNRATKVSTTSFDGFASPHYQALGELGDGIAIEAGNALPPAAKSPPFVATGKTAPDVRIVTVYPGITASHLEPLLAAPDLQGVILRTFGAGNAPTDAAFADTVGRCVEKWRNSGGRLAMSAGHGANGALQRQRRPASARRHRRRRTDHGSRLHQTLVAAPATRDPAEIADTFRREARGEGQPWIARPLVFMQNRL